MTVRGPAGALLAGLDGTGPAPWAQRMRQAAIAALVPVCGLAGRAMFPTPSAAPQAATGWTVCPSDRRSDS